MEQNEILDMLIEFLQSLRNNPEVTINVIPPHIEEVCSTWNKQYGKVKSKIEIEANILYTKDKTKMFDNWKKVE